MHALVGLVVVYVYMYYVHDINCHKFMYKNSINLCCVVYLNNVYRLFNFQVGQGYPHDAPKVKCETQVCFELTILGSFDVHVHEYGATVVSFYK